MRRRTLLSWPLGLPLASQAGTEEAADAQAEALLLQGGVVVALRHALAPGTFDPPQFRLHDCSTQRNLNDEGRAQARRVGQWFRARQLLPVSVRSSPWCRCLDTAMLAFGRAEPWAALSSPRGIAQGINTAARQELARALVNAPRGKGRFEVWVTHQFVLNDLVGEPTGAGEAWLLRANAQSQAEIVGRLRV